MLSQSGVLLTDCSMLRTLSQISLEATAAPEGMVNQSPLQGTQQLVIPSTVVTKKPRRSKDHIFLSFRFFFISCVEQKKTSHLILALFRVVCAKSSIPGRFGAKHVKLLKNLLIR